MYVCTIRHPIPHKIIAAVVILVNFSDKILHGFDHETLELVYQTDV